MRRSIALVAAAAVAQVVLVWPAPAYAHGQLAFSEPANQSTLAQLSLLLHGEAGLILATTMLAVAFVVAWRRRRSVGAR